MFPDPSPPRQHAKIIATRWLINLPKFTGTSLGALCPATSTPRILLLQPLLVNGRLPRPGISESRRRAMSVINDPWQLGCHGSDLNRLLD